MQLILASQSPRRRALLDSIGLTYTVETGPELDEDAVLADASIGDFPARMLELARRKGRPVSLANPDSLVLSADTMVLLDEHRLGKPADPADALRMLSLLSGRVHHVATAVVLQRSADGLCLQELERTEVRFRKLPQESLQRYLERARPWDKAGAYAIQDLGSLLVERISGDYPNIVGLPLVRTAQMLEKAGIPVL
ncbi:septum formation protein Maf [bacterium]|nr:septum formation protein Maf [bacterium]